MVRKIFHEALDPKRFRISEGPDFKKADREATLPMQRMYCILSTSTYVKGLMVSIRWHSWYLKWAVQGSSPTSMLNPFSRGFGTT